MKIELFSFQQRAAMDLHRKALFASDNYSRGQGPQVISFTAPTGAGKTIILAALFDRLIGGYAELPEQPQSIIVWLSDSPELNQQSLDKIATRSDHFPYRNCTVIDDASFNLRVLEEGHLYFLNTQKIGSKGNLTQHSDGREYTIWETLANTVKSKGRYLYFVIDEAHRGTSESREISKANSIMQKFIKGDPEVGLPPMPVVIGVSATAERFNRLVRNYQCNFCNVLVQPEEVRSSGLLKDRIIISYPEEGVVDKDLSVLQAAALDWQDKCAHWYQYCYEQHYGQVNPIFVIQVENGAEGVLSKTELAEALKIIEQATGETFTTGEVVHTFGQTKEAVEIGGIEVRYLEPSRIQDDARVRVVFFKENLSTGWDCPRAETMMSFRTATDTTYIAQLLGRMVRTPRGERVKVDESLNEVHLFLPHFNAETVKEIVDYLQRSDEGSLGAEIETESLNSPKREILTVNPKPRPKITIIRPVNVPPPLTDTPQQGPVPQEPTQTDLFAGLEVPPYSDSSITASAPAPTPKPDSAPLGSAPGTAHPAADAPGVAPRPQPETAPAAAAEVAPQPEVEPLPDPGFDRREIVDAVNGMGLLTYALRRVRVNNYTNSLHELAGLLNDADLDKKVRRDINESMVEMIHDYIEKLKKSGEYGSLSDKALQFNLSSSVYHVYERAAQQEEVRRSVYTTAQDLDRQYALAERILGGHGYAYDYANTYYPDSLSDQAKIDVILYVASNPQDEIEAYSKKFFRELCQQYRRAIATQSGYYQKLYERLVNNVNIVSELNLRLPYDIDKTYDQDAPRCIDHLYVDNSGYATIRLNSWEQAVLDEERQAKDYVCWLRNYSRKAWALAIIYDQDGEKNLTYPDFLIVRKDKVGYVVDVLEPHDPSRRDNLPKAKGFARYAAQNTLLGRIELIRQGKPHTITGKSEMIRLDLANLEIREAVISAQTNEELDHLFELYGTSRAPGHGL